MFSGGLRIAVLIATAAAFALVGCTAPDARTTTTLSADPMRPAASQAPVPVYLEIPSIGLTTGSPLIPLGLDEHKRLKVPDVHTPEIGGWFERGVRPGDPGPAVIVAHVDGDGRPGLFAHLHELTPGAEITVGRIDGSQVRFAATRIERHRKLEFPTEAVYGDTPDPQLRLITCGGSFDTAAGTHVENIIVFAGLAPS